MTGKKVKYVWTEYLKPHLDAQGNEDNGDVDFSAAMDAQLVDAVIARDKIFPKGEGGRRPNTYWGLVAADLASVSPYFKNVPPRKFRQRYESLKHRSAQHLSTATRSQTASLTALRSSSLVFDQFVLHRGGANTRATAQGNRIFLYLQ